MLAKADEGGSLLFFLLFINSIEVSIDEEVGDDNKFVALLLLSSFLFIFDDV